MIDWTKVPNFKSEHFPESPDMFADPDLIYALQAFRTKVRRSIFPSPVAGEGKIDLRTFVLNACRA